VRRLAGDGVRRIDVGRLTCAPGVTRYFANIAEAGLGATVVAGTAGLPFDIEADGELLGTTPATFEVIAGAIRLKT
jgi:diacylglycerol kinase family enzyme